MEGKRKWERWKAWVSRGGEGRCGRARRDVSVKRVFPVRSGIRLVLWLLCASRCSRDGLTELLWEARKEGGREEGRERNGGIERIN